MIIKAKTAAIIDRGERNATAGMQIEGQALIGIRVPSGFKGGEISIQASVDNADWQEVFDHQGLAPLAGIPAHPGRLIALDPDLTTPWSYVRIACNQAQPAGLTFALRVAQLQGQS